MGLNNKEDEFWNRNNDSFWDSDERYIRKDEYRQPEGMPSQTTQWQYMPEMNSQNWNASQIVDEHKRNTRILLHFLVGCAAVMAVGILVTVLMCSATRRMMEEKIRELDYDTYEHQAQDTFIVNGSNVKVSNAFMVYGSEEVWMPAGKWLVAVYVEAAPEDKNTYVYDRGISNPYLEYDGHYTEPLMDQKLKDMLVKEGMKEDELLYPYSVGNYQKEAGYYFFLIDEDTQELRFVIDKRENEKGKGRVEYLKERHFVELELAEEGMDYE